MAITWKVIYCHLLATLAFLSDKVYSECEFPKFVQSTHPWTASYKNGGILTAYFKPDIMEASFCPSRDKRCVKYERKCLNEVEEGKYIVEYTERTYSDVPSEYLCIQFIQRSQHIIQLRMSNHLTHPSPNMCLDANLSLDKWPIISALMNKSPPIPCPFSGGYNMKISSPRNPESEMCSRKVILPRIESECEGGDGIHFDFRYKDCIHENLKMKIKQRVECVAQWEDGPYTFVIIRPESNFEAWCMRLKQPLDNLEKGHLFMDLVCDPGNGHGQIQETFNYLALTFIRITIPTVCANEFEGCTDTRFCGIDMSNYCHRSCGRCKPEVDLCPFQEDIQGKWILERNERTDFISVSPYQLEWPDIGNFKCLQINNDPKNGDRYVNKTVLLHTFDNGCYPRFACMETFRPATSVRQFRIGNRVKWPIFPIKEALEIACHPNRFKIDVPFNDQTKSVPMPWTSVIQTRRTYSQSCLLPSSFGFRDEALYFKEGNKCDGCISYGSGFGDRITVRPLNCSKFARRRMEYICLASYQFDNVTQAVITGTQESSSGMLKEYLCWIFTGVGKARRIIVVKASECSSLSLELALENQILPTAQFEILDPPPKICPYDLVYAVTENPLPTERSSPRQTEVPYRRGDNVISPPVTYGQINGPQKDTNIANALTSSLISLLFVLNISLYCCIR